jgi:hypothetical protein
MRKFWKMIISALALEENSYGRFSERIETKTSSLAYHGTKFTSRAGILFSSW